ncbi:Pyrimidine-specific ribonucleoside hydrolase RihB [uncultured archaeon]|nr:Pyrimidine-specific ribonucleoside hydrolase RihB [uncultured archaeon]
MKQRIIIDSDAGTDVDDLFALTYAIKNPNSNLVGITLTHGDTEIRARITRKLERLLGVDIPITAGVAGPKSSIKKYWTGFEKLALTEEELKESFKNSPYPTYTKNTKLICIGPLTNIALQLEINPTIKNVKDLYVMGGCIDSHNFKSDIESWKRVQEEPWNIYQVTKEDSDKISFTKDELAKLNVSPLGNFLYESAVRWLDYTNTDSWIDHPPKTKCAMYDVLTVSAGLEEPYVKFKQVSKNRFVSCDVDLDLKNKIIDFVRS